MRIALINSPSLAHRPVSRSMAGGLGFDGNAQMLLPPLDLALMAATLRNAGESVDLIDADPLGLDAAGVFARMDGQAWDGIVATVSLPAIEQDAWFLAELRRRYPAAKVFAKTLVRDHGVLDTLLKRSGADCVIHGEADLIIVDLVHGRSRSGTAWLEPGEAGAAPTFRFNEGEPVADLNQLPLPARDLLPNDRYVYPLLGTPVATLQTSRGCPYPCGYYCPYPLVEGVKWRSQTPERVFAELKDVVERFGLTKLYFRDATFTLNQERIERLCDLIVDAGWRLEWVCETRVDCLGDRLLEKMSAAGCVGILIGVETGDEAVMHHREGKKGLTVPKLAHVREKAGQLGIRLHFLLIVGLPKETRESIVATYDLIQRYRPDTIGVTIITPYPGTPLYKDALQQGWIDSQQWKDYGGHQVPMHTPHLSREDLIAGKRFLEEGFAILQRRTKSDDAGLEAVAVRHYEQFLRWAYRLDEPIAAIRQASMFNAPRSPAQSIVHAATSASLPSDALKNRTGPALSVALPTYNRRDILRRTLLAFASQTLAPDQFEVIVADDGSTDDTVAMLRRFNAPYSLRVLPHRHVGANASRNRAIRAAQGDVVLITGDDMIPEPGFLEAHLKFHRQHPDEMDAMLGFIDWSPEIAVTPFMKFLVSPEGGHQFAFHEVRNGQADFRLFYTSNVSVKRGLLDRQAMLFDEEFTYPAYDDTELGYRLARQGMRLHFNPLAVTKHHHEMTPESFAARQRNAGRMAVILARKHPSLDEPLLGLANAKSSPAAAHEETVRRLLDIVHEVEKPDLAALAAVRMQGGGFDQYYAKAVLYPLYHALLRSAYYQGVTESLSAFTQGTPALLSQDKRPRFTASIIIPVFNKVELTRQCLEHLASVTDDVEYEVILVDDASTDDTAAFLELLGGDVQVIRNPVNMGFAKSCNRGAAAARGRYLVFLNNDTIPLPGWLRALIDEADAHAEVAIVGSKLLYPNGTIQHAGVAFSKILFSPYHIYSGSAADDPAVNRRREFQCVTAACMLVRREVFEGVGGFDEGYRNGFEDVDLCLKIGEQGRKIIYQPTSVLYHLESQSPGRKAHDVENSRRLQERWLHKWWLADEDLFYVEDGFACRNFEEDGLFKTRLERLSDAEQHRKWHLVVEAQRAAHRQDHAALKSCVTRVDEWPDDVWVLRWAVRVCRYAGTPDVALAFWKRVLALEEDPDALAAVAQESIQRGDLDGADRLLARLFVRKPDHGDGWFLRAVTAMQRDRHAEAEAAFEHARCHGGDWVKTGLGLCMAAMGQGQIEKVWERSAQLLSSHPDNAEALHWLLKAGTALERWGVLADELNRYVRRNPADLSARFAYAGVLVRVGRLDSAKREYEAIRHLDPGFEGLGELEKAVIPQDECVTSHGAQ